MNKIKERLTALRKEMEKLGIDAWYVSGTDPHSSEYLPDRWQTRSFISGFAGSYGLVVITQEEAALWTDTRYFLQAEEQLDGTGVSMNKLRVPGAVSPEKWLINKLKPGAQVGIDPQTISVNGFKILQNILFEKNIELVQTGDLFDKIWKDRVQISSNKIYELDHKYTGATRKQKQDFVTGKLKKYEADVHVISMLDELAWVFNLRGSDVSYNPVFTGFGIIGEEGCSLFVDPNKLSNKLKIRLQNEGIELKNYQEFYPFLKLIRNKRIFLDEKTANHLIYSCLSKDNEIVFGTSVISKLKACKNKTELVGFKKAMIKDGIALVEFHEWLKANIGKSEISEYDIGQKLAEYRSKQENFKGESFPAIVGYKEHGAIVHLSVNSSNALPVEADGILLFDSGGQYLEGTTDITRTVALGRVAQQQKRDYTLVLKGMIALTEAKFPFGTKGCHIDILARKALWEKGLNYGHGTGHGVGHFLNVHEGPMAIRQEYNENLIEPGMVISNEPAFYREGEYGIRTENMMVCVEKEKTEFGQFLGFETLTLCPIDTTLIDTEIFDNKEKEWLNHYHQKVNDELKPFLKPEYHKMLDYLTQQI